MSRSDPQYGEILPIAKVSNVRELSDGEAFRVGQLMIAAHLTPGHTPGGTSWTWISCEGGRCLNMVYADSITPISADGFKFTDSKQSPGGIAGFEKSFGFLDNTPCDILVTPHAEASDFWERIDARRRGVVPDPLIDPSACRRLADSGRKLLQARIANETPR